MSKLSRAAALFDPRPERGSAMTVTIARPTQIDRVQELRIVTPDEASSVAVILGDDILDDQPALLAILKAQKEIRADGMRLLDAAIGIGRTLNDLQETVGRSRFAQVCKYSSSLFPGLSRGNVSKLMAVADFDDKEVINRSLMPATYSVVYELTTIPTPDLHHAFRTGTIRPDSTRRDILNWKRAHETAPSPATPQQQHNEAIHIASLKQELEKIRRDRAALTERHLVLRRRQREVEQALYAVPE